MAKAETATATDNRATPPRNERLHKASYATDKRKGGYIIRVEGPQSNAFAGREVPVTTMKGDEHTEKLTKLIWSGTDKESGRSVSLYQFESKPRDLEDEIPF